MRTQDFLKPVPFYITGLRSALLLLDKSLLLQLFFDSYFFYFGVTIVETCFGRSIIEFGLNYDDINSNSVCFIFLSEILETGFLQATSVGLYGISG